MFKVEWKSLQRLHGQFSWKSASGRIFKIGPHQPKLWIRCLIYRDNVYSVDTLSSWAIYQDVRPRNVLDHQSRNYDGSRLGPGHPLSPSTYSELHIGHLRQKFTQLVVRALQCKRRLDASNATTPRRAWWIQKSTGTRKQLTKTYIGLQCRSGTNRKRSSGPT